VRIFPGESASRAAAFGAGLALDIMPGCPDLAMLADAAAGPDDTYHGVSDDELIGVLCALGPSRSPHGRAQARRCGRADVVQPGGSFQQVGVSAENGCPAACPGGDALGVRPAAGKRLLQQCPDQLFGPGSQPVHAA
jgi:hypothetical protein